MKLVLTAVCEVLNVPSHRAEHPLWPEASCPFVHTERAPSYVGTLHKFDSKDDTIALEQVVSADIERPRPGEEIPAYGNIYEYVVFRCNDLKDLRFQKPAQKSEWPQRPNDPAILSVSFPTLPTYLPYLPSPLQETHTM